MKNQELTTTLQQMLEEDDYDKDITSAVTPQKKIKAEIISRQPGILSGLDETQEIFSICGITANSSEKEGQRIEENQTIISLEGNSRDILACERTALNLLSAMSGIATLTNQYVKQASKSNPKITIAATRKTTPLFRYFEKKAVKSGGGWPHRFSLSDAVLIKDNHLLLFPSITDALEATKSKYANDKIIEVEVETIDEAVEAVKAQADIVMLDNFTPKKIKKAIKELENQNLRNIVKLEASGGITLENVKDYAATEVDIISIGALTHSAKALDFSLEVKNGK